MDTNVLTDAGMLRGVVSGMLFCSHGPSLCMRVLVWRILIQNRVIFREGERKTTRIDEGDIEHQVRTEIRGRSWDLHSTFF